MDYFINTRVGVVHANGCTTLALCRAENVAPWDPAKAHLAPGVIACPACMDGLPTVERFVELLEDPDGAPYQGAVQTFVRHLDLLPTGVDLDLLVAALEETAWYAWRDGNDNNESGINPHQKPEAEG